MKYLKNNDGAVFAFEIDGSQDSIIPPGLVEMTALEVAGHLETNGPKAQNPRKVEIFGRLSAIDADTIRAVRVALIEQANARPVPPFERAKLAALESEAATLRAELATL